MFYIKMMVTTTFLIIAFLMLMSNNPISLVILIMAQSLWTAFTSNIYKESFWYGYILILIFLGGMLVLFSYICSLTPNLMFQTSQIKWLPLIILISLMLNVNIPFNKTINFSYISSTYPYNLNYSLMIIILIYLMITLMIITMITSFKSGPLQSIK